MDTDGIELHRSLTSVALAFVLMMLLTLAPTPVHAQGSVARLSVDGFGSGQGLTVTGVDRVDERLVKLTVTTKALSEPVRINLLLPAGYDDSTRRYPVLYLLHGTSGGADDWTTTGNAREATADLPLIVVMPDGGYDSNGGGWWTNWVDQGTSLGVANWETFHIDQVIGWVDAHLRTQHRRNARAIAGLSQGGFGAFSYAARHPDRFVSAASFSGALDIAQNPAAQAMGPMVVGGIMAGMNQVQPFAPFGDPVTDATVWKGHNPASLVTNLAGMDLRLWSGNGTPGADDLADTSTPPTPDPIEAIVHASSTFFAQAADAAHIPYVFDDYGPGMHRWRYWNRDLVQYLPHLMKVLAAKRAAPRTISYRSIDRSYRQWGWQVRVKRADGYAFTGLSKASPRGFTYTGDDAALITTPRELRNGRHTVIVGGQTRHLVATGHRLRIPVPAGSSRIRIR